MEKAAEISDYYLEHGTEATQKRYGLSHETIRRYKRIATAAEDMPQMSPPKERLVKQISERYSEAELKSIAAGGRHPQVHSPRVTADWFNGETLRLGVVSDSHIGSIYFREDWWDGACEQLHQADVDATLHIGDLSEGMSNRPGHIYELSHIGYNSQREECIRQADKLPRPLYMIDGNHDRWWIKQAGAKIVPDVCDAIGAEFLGHDVGDLYIGGIHIMLWHGEDGASYAHSYRLQKIIEALPGGEKPNILLAGHVHKMGYFFIRNVHAISAGALQAQSAWMRSKRLEAHPGFWILEMDINNGSIVRFTPTFFPYY